MLYYMVKEKSMDYQPNFTVSAQAISMVAEISALSESYAISLEMADSKASFTSSEISVAPRLIVSKSTLS